MNYGVIFDCDGVLVDSEKLGCKAAALTLNQFGVKTDQKEIEQFIGRANHEFLRYFEKRDGISLEIDRISEAISANYFCLAESLRPMPGIERLLRELTAIGIPLAVASSGAYEKIRFSLKMAGLTRFCPILCSAVEVAKGKPEPDLFIWAVQRLRLPPEQCYVVEDSVFGVQAGKQAGILTIGYTASFPKSELRRAGADWVIDDYAELTVTAKGLRLR
jgi:HAD superfamily hydrolase (TIGR01509 family)